MSDVIPEAPTFALRYVRQLLWEWTRCHASDLEKPGAAMSGAMAVHADGHVHGVEYYLVIAAAEYMRLQYLDASGKEHLTADVQHFLAESREFVVPVLRACMTELSSGFGPISSKWRETCVEIHSMGLQSDRPITVPALTTLVTVLALRDLVDPSLWYLTKEYADRVVAVGSVSTDVRARATQYLQDGTIGEAHPATSFLRSIAGERQGSARMAAILDRYSF